MLLPSKYTLIKACLRSLPEAPSQPPSLCSQCLLVDPLAIRHFDIADARQYADLYRWGPSMQECA